MSLMLNIIIGQAMKKFELKIRLIIWDSLFRNMATKRHQIDNVNMVNRRGKVWELAKLYAITLKYGTI